MKRFTKTEDDFIKAQYLTLTYNQLAKGLGRAMGSVVGRMKVLGLVVPPEIIADRCRESQKNVTGNTASRFKKGLVPWNKGKTMDAETYKKCKGTMFKAGIVPRNTKYFGKPYQVTRKTRNGYYEKRWVIQVNNRRIGYLRYLCDMNGVDLTGKKPVLKPDVNPDNVPTFDDIMIITNAENMQRNSFLKYPDDVRQLFQSRRVLTRIINQKLNTKKQ